MKFKCLPLLTTPSHWFVTFIKTKPLDVPGVSCFHSQFQFVTYVYNSLHDHGSRCASQVLWQEEQQQEQQQARAKDSWNAAKFLEE